MNVKVKRVDLIAALKKAIKVREAAIAQQEKNNLEYDKAVKDRREAIKAAVLSGKAKITEATLSYRNNGEATVTVVLPAALTTEIKRKQIQHVSISQHEIDEIKSAIALLELSDEDHVNASAYKNVAQYLA